MAKKTCIVAFALAFSPRMWENPPSTRKRSIASIMVFSFLMKRASVSGSIESAQSAIMTCAMLIPAVLVYRKNKSRKGALISLAVGSVAMIVVAALVNAFLLFPMLTKTMPSLEFILTSTIPFNALKAVVISAITYLVYKPLSPVLHGKR